VDIASDRREVRSLAGQSDVRPFPAVVARPESAWPPAQPEGRSGASTCRTRARLARLRPRAGTTPRCPSHHGRMWALGTEAVSRHFGGHSYTRSQLAVSRLTVNRPARAGTGRRTRDQRVTTRRPASFNVSDTGARHCERLGVRALRITDASPRPWAGCSQLVWRTSLARQEASAVLAVTGSRSASVACTERSTLGAAPTGCWWQAKEQRAGPGRAAPT
jgi:hypothetical protein